MPEVKLHANKFEDMVARRGRDVEWQQAVLCSCWNMDSGSPSYHCKACGGLGFTYEAPVIERALVMSVTQSKDFEEMAGVFDVGDAVMTVPKRVFTNFFAPNNTSGVGTMRYERDNAMYDVGMNDLITLLDDEYKTSELLVKGTELNGRPADTLLNPKVTKVLTIRVSDPVTGDVTRYEPDTDFTWDGGTIVWVGNQPDEGTVYSVTYKHRPVYTVFINLPKPRYQDNQELPRYVALRYRAGGFDPK